MTQTEHNYNTFTRACGDLKLRIDEVGPHHLRTFIGDKVYDYYTQTGKVNVPGEPYFTKTEDIAGYIKDKYAPIKDAADAARARIHTFRNTGVITSAAQPAPIVTPTPAQEDTPVQPSAPTTPIKRSPRKSTNNEQGDKI